MQRRLAAILAADLVGYSRLMGLDESGTHERLGIERREFIDPLIAEHRGRIVKTQGDGILVEFGSVVDAVTAAVSWQEGSALRQAGQPDERRFVFRIGINVGDVIVDGDDLYGDGVNIAARLEAQADPGGVLLSHLAFLQVRGPTDFEFEDLGERRLKNIAEPVRLHRVVLPEVASPPGISRPSTSYDVPARPSIAVLPLVNQSGDPGREYLADALTDDLITALSRIRWLFVIARSSTFVYSGRVANAQEVASDLGVRYVLEGSVRTSGNTIRVNARLVLGDTGRQIWARRYEGSLDDVFEVQDEITRAIVGELEPEVGRAERERVATKRPENLGAWEMYQRGMAHLYRYTAPDLAEAARLFRQAIELEPGMAAAHAGIAEAMYYEVVYGHAGDAEANRVEAQTHARIAVEAAPEDPAAHCTYGRVCYLVRRHEEALLEFDTCLALNPSFALAHYGKGATLVFSGRSEESFPHLEQAVRLSPFDPNMGSFLVRHADAHYFRGRDEEAISWAKRALQQPGFQWSRYAVLIAALGRLGRQEEASNWLEIVLHDRPDFSVDFVQRTHLFSDERDMEAFLAGLRTGGVP